MLFAVSDATEFDLVIYLIPKCLAWAHPECGLKASALSPKETGFKQFYTLALNPFIFSPSPIE